MIDESVRRVLDKIRANADEHGRAVMQIVEPRAAHDPTNNTFTYTLGNCRKGLPELLIVGGVDFQWLMNMLSEEMIKRGRGFDDGERVDLGGRFPVVVVDAKDEVEETFHLLVRRAFPDVPFRVQQVVCPDTNGRFPWEAACEEPYRSVVVHRAKPIQ